MNQPMVIFLVGVSLGLGMGFVWWHDPTPAREALSRVEAVPAPPPEEAPATAPVAAQPSSRPKSRVPRTPIAVKPKESPGPTTEALIAEHWESSIDAEWSEASTEKLREDFERLKPSRAFTVANIDCRKTSCVAVLDWEDESQAQASGEELLGAAFQLLCSKALQMPAGKTTAGYRVTLLFHTCAR
jgi:hypothetical protein